MLVLWSWIKRQAGRVSWVECVSIVVQCNPTGRQINLLGCLCSAEGASASHRSICANHYYLKTGLARKAGLARTVAVRAPTHPPSCTASSLIPNGSTIRSFSTHGQQSAAKGSSTTVSRSDIRLIQLLGSSAHGLVRRWRLVGYSLSTLITLPPAPRAHAFTTRQPAPAAE